VRILPGECPLKRKERMEKPPIDLTRPLTKREVKEYLKIRTRVVKKMQHLYILLQFGDLIKTGDECQRISRKGPWVKTTFKTKDKIRFTPEWRLIYRRKININTTTTITIKTRQQK